MYFRKGQLPIFIVNVSALVIFAALGVGALNEIVEFVVSAVVPESGVGGYLNTSLDLVADLIGAILAMVLIRLRGRELIPDET